MLAAAAVDGSSGDGIFAAAVNNHDNAMVLSAMVFILDFEVLRQWSIVVAKMAVVVVSGRGRC